MLGPRGISGVRSALVDAGIGLGPLLPVAAGPGADGPEGPEGADGLDGALGEDPESCFGRCGGGGPERRPASISGGQPMNGGGVAPR